jgi:hypothetical protein
LSIEGVAWPAQCSKQIIFLCLRGRRRSAVLLSQTAYAERLMPPLVEEETPLCSSDMWGMETAR